MKFKDLKTGLLLFLLGCFLVGFEVEAKENKSVKIEINYGDKKSSDSYVINWQKGLSVLESLIQVAEVSTHPVGKYVFVTSVNSIEGTLGKNVWYYMINGKPANELAFSRKLKKGDVITWIYKQDVCSRKEKEN